MFNRIIVPLDGSEVAESALLHAVSMADCFKAELILLRAIFLPQVVELDLTEAQLALVRESENYLNQVAQRIQEPGRRVRIDVRCSTAAEAIIESAASDSTCAVVMATHGQSGPEQWPMGSIAEKVLRSLQVPVLLVRPVPCLA